MKRTAKLALINALITTAYIIAIASFLFYTPKLLGQEKPTVLIPIIMLLLFVFSAAFTGAAVFGMPVLWYLEGRKKDALSLIAYTLAFLFLTAIAALFALFLYSR